MFLSPAFAQNLWRTIGGLLNFCLGSGFRANFRNTAGGLHWVDFRLSRETSGTLPADHKRFVSTSGFRAKRFALVPNASLSRAWHRDSGSSLHALKFGGSWKVLGQGKRTASGFLSLCRPPLKTRVATRNGAPNFAAPNPFQNPREPAGAEIDSAGLAGPISRQGIFRGRPVCEKSIPGLPVSAFETGALPRFRFSPRLRPGRLLARYPGGVRNTAGVFLAVCLNFRFSPKTFRRRPADYSRLVSTSGCRANFRYRTQKPGSGPRALGIAYRPRAFARRQRDRH